MPGPTPDTVQLPLFFRFQQFRSADEWRKPLFYVHPLASSCARSAALACSLPLRSILTLALAGCIPPPPDMLWASWTTLVPTLLVSCAVLSWWFSEPKTVHLNLIVAIGCILFCWAVAPELTRDFPASLYAYLRTAIHEYQFDRVLLRNATMIVTSAALLW